MSHDFPFCVKHRKDNERLNVCGLWPAFMTAAIMAAKRRFFPSEKNHHFPYGVWLRNGIAGFLRYLLGGRRATRIDLDLAGVRADAASRCRNPSNRALQDNDERRAWPRGDNPSNRARSWK